ncbi:hypothetical protein K438DRAFT_381530 [Mycena galopus ATCC 62051]|nr:hypothetical protein K438DRAFT_381530 [Mycena galopus ATCC 62051]
MLRCRPLPQWAQCNRTRSLHSSAVQRSTYRGYSMHGTLREWALRMLLKEDLTIAAPARRDRRARPHMIYAKRLMETADGYVYNEPQKKARNKKAPEGRRGRMMRMADSLFEGAEPRGREAGVKVAGDQRGRLREALRLYLRASQRGKNTMPIISSRVWGATHLMQRRTVETVRRLDTTDSKVSRVSPKDIANWGVQTRPRRKRGKEVNDCLPEWAPGAGPPKDVQPSARGLAYKTQQQLPPLHRLAPSAIERARMPLLQAFPGVSNVGGTLGHAFFASRGLLSTPSSSASAPKSGGPPASYSDLTILPTALSHAGAPRPYDTDPGLAPSPSTSGSSSAHPSLSTPVNGNGVASLVTKTQHASPTSTTRFPRRS